MEIISIIWGAIILGDKHEVKQETRDRFASQKPRDLKALETHDGTQVLGDKPDSNTTSLNDRQGKQAGDRDTTNDMDN